MKAAGRGYVSVSDCHKQSDNELVKERGNEMEDEMEGETRRGGRWRSGSNAVSCMLPTLRNDKRLLPSRLAGKNTNQRAGM